MSNKYTSSILFIVLVSFLFSCNVPGTVLRRGAGGADHGDGGDIGGSKDLFAPKNFTIANNGTGTDTFLTLTWDTVPNAELYRVYRAVYPTAAHTAQPGDREFKLLTTVDAGSASMGKVSARHNIERLPLRRYAYKVTAVNSSGESESTKILTGYRVPRDEIEALKDIDYTVHFAQNSINNFGAAFQKATVYGRGGGQYYYESTTSPKSQFSGGYNDFEVKIEANPSMKLNIFTRRVTMNGDLFASGLYTAKLTYHNLLGAEGGLSKNGEVSIEYNHPTRGKLSRKLDFNTARSTMKTVAFDNSEKKGLPPSTEWDEAHPGYTRMMKTRRGN